MSEIRFTFKLEKLVQALAFFSSKGVRELTKLKAAKLLYFADKAHLLEYGRPILGDVYFCLPYGPVPSIALNEMNDAIQQPEVEEADLPQDRAAFLRVLKVHKPLFGGHHVFQAKGFDADVFSESELQVLDNVVQRYGSCTAGQLVDLTHKEVTWAISDQHRDPGGRAPIPYELFFAGAPEGAQKMLDLVRSEQEDMRELDEVLGRRGPVAAV